MNFHATREPSPTPHCLHWFLSRFEHQTIVPFGEKSIPSREAIFLFVPCLNCTQKGRKTGVRYFQDPGRVLTQVPLVTVQPTANGCSNDKRWRYSLHFLYHVLVSLASKCILRDFFLLCPKSQSIIVMIVSEFVYLKVINNLHWIFTRHYWHAELGCFVPDINTELKTFSSSRILLIKLFPSYS